MRYFKIEGIFESKGDLNLDDLNYFLLENIEEINLQFGGKLVEVDSEGNEIN